MFFHGGCGRRVSHCAEEGRGPGTHPIFRLRAERLRTRLHRSLLFLFLGECSPPLFFRGWGGTPPISKALRCGGGAALLLRKEWRAAKVRISFVVQRRCCPFFSARAEEVARCQCLRGWAQAVGRVTPSWDGGPPWCSWGMWQEGQPLCRGGKGARHTHNLSSPSRRIADTVPQEYSRREDAAQQGDVCEGYPRHASGRRGRRSLHPTLV